LSGSEEPRQATDPGAAELVAGRIGRAHGLDGSFYVTRPRPRLLLDGGEVRVQGKRLAVVRRAGTEQRPILRLAGVESREQAEALRGQELTVPAALAPTLGEGEWWAHELEGCAVYDGERTVGTVKAMIELPSCEALEVQRPEGGQPLLVPMVRAAVRSVDPAAKRVEVDLAFLGLDEPEPGKEQA
jgi:16S rRNA processing protein RimM